MTTSTHTTKTEPFVWTKQKGKPTPLQRTTYHSALIPGTIRPGRIIVENHRPALKPSYTCLGRFGAGMISSESEAELE